MSERELVYAWKDELDALCQSRDKLARLRERSQAVVKAWEGTRISISFVAAMRLEPLQGELEALRAELNGQESGKKCVGDNPEPNEGRQ